MIFNQESNKKIDDIWLESVNNFEVKKLTDYLVIQEEVKKLDKEVNKKLKECKEYYPEFRDFAFLASVGAFGYLGRNILSDFAIFYIKLIFLLYALNSLAGYVNATKIKKCIHSLDLKKEDLINKMAQLKVNTGEEKFIEDIKSSKGSLYEKLIDDYARNRKAFKRMYETGVLKKYLIVNYSSTYIEFVTALEVITAFVLDDIKKEEDLSLVRIKK